MMIVVLFDSLANLFVIVAYRQSSQKPSDELFERFRQSFSGVNGTEEEQQLAGISALQDSTLNKPRYKHIQYRLNSQIAPHHRRLLW